MYSIRWAILLTAALLAPLSASAGMHPQKSKTSKSKKSAAPKKPAKKTPAGGANQIEGLRGKIGDVLFDGKWRFQVLSMDTPATYTAVRKADIQTDYAVYRSVADFDNDRTFKPQAGNSLIVLRCRVKNGVKENRQLYCVPSFTRTALADQQGTSYPPIAYDMPGSIYQSRPLLPGASLDFAVIFAVPQGTQPKDLIFTLRTISGGPKEGRDVRVSLTK